MFTKTPRLILKNSVNIKLIIKVEKDFMISQILGLEAIVSSHRGVKVQARTSTLRARFVRNLASMEKSKELFSFVKQHPRPSLSNKVRRL